MIDAVKPPERKRVRGVAARDVDHVLVGELLGWSLRRSKQPEATRLAVPT